MKIYYSKISLFIFLNCFLLFACSGSNSEEAVVSIKPTNLVVTPTIVGLQLRLQMVMEVAW